VVVEKVLLPLAQIKNWVGMYKNEQYYSFRSFDSIFDVYIYAYKEISSPPLKPKVEVKFYNQNF